MKILWICGARVMGGAERVTIQLIELLRERGHEIDALCPPGSPVREALAPVGALVRLAPSGGPTGIPAAWAIARTLRDNPPDVALVTTSSEWVSSCLAPRSPQTRLVLVRHMALPLGRAVCWLANRRADAVVAVSHAVQDSLAGSGGLSPERIHVIYNPARFPPRAALPTAEERCRARAALGLQANGRWVGFFGGLSVRKGIEDMLSAVRHANEALGPTHLLICGRPARRRDGRSIEELTRTHGLHDRMRYLGEIERMVDALTAVDVVVMPTRRALKEALPLTLMEAMACGTPVLGYASGGIPEVIGADGVAGRLAQPDNAADLGRVLVDMLADPAAAQRHAAAALLRVRQLFDPQRAADAYEQLFTRIVAGGDCG